MKHNIFNKSALAICGLALIGFAGCASKPTPASATDATGATSAAPAKTISAVEFAKTNFTALTEGDTSVQSALDWDNFKSAGVNVGEIYAKMPNETEKAAFRQSFIESFSKSFKSSGARASDVSNWRIETETPTQTVVIGSATSGKTIAVTLSKTGGEQKMTALEIR